MNMYKKPAKLSYKYRNLSFYNSQFNDKAKKKSSNISIPNMMSQYANNIISKPILLKKNIKNSQIMKGQQFDDSRTRNPQSGIFTTNETAPYKLTSESYLQMKSTERKAGN